MRHYLLFTGHMIDAAGRSQDRFPPSKEGKVREVIKGYLEEAMKLYQNKILGIAGGACGGDILFHELCLELGIASEVYLALPEDDFKKASVSFAGREWEKRYNQLLKALPVQVLPPVKKEDNVWEKTNQWMLQASLKQGGDHMTLLALWDKKTGDGPGGTGHMIDVAREHGAKTQIIDITLL